MRAWRRVGPWTLRTVCGAVFAALGVGLTGLLGYAVVALGWPLVLGLAGWGPLLVWTLYWWRTQRSGVFVGASATGESAIRVRSVPRTRTFTAAGVADVRIRWRRIAAGSTGIRVREVCFDLLDGRSVGTTIHGDAREGRGRAARGVLSAPVFDMIVDRLSQHVEDAEPWPAVAEPELEAAPDPATEPERSERGRRKPPPGIIEWR